jgi:hypothetical protein
MYLHNAVGVVISDRNLGANIVAGANPDEIAISGTDYLEDHGLETTIPDSGGASVTWRFFYTDAGGKWVQYSSAAPFPSVYNNAGVVAALPANRWGVFQLYASKDDIGRLRVGAAIGVGGDNFDRVKLLVEAGVDLVTIDTAHGHSKGVIDTLKRMKKLFPTIDITVPNYHYFNSVITSLSVTIRKLGNFFKVCQRVAFCSRRLRV